MLGSLFGSGLFSGDRSFTKGFNTDSAAEYISQHMFDQTAMEWKTNAAGQQIITLSKDQWKLVDHILLSMYMDDGQGLIDLGTDNVYDFDDDGNLVAVNDNTWLTIDGKAVAYYYESTLEGADGQGNVGEDCYMITGYVPVVYNGRMAKLIVIFDSANPKGYIGGLRIDYNSGDKETPLLSKTLSAYTQEDTSAYTTGEGDPTVDGELVDLAGEGAWASLQVGDNLQFVADYYDYDGNYLDSYVVGQWTVTKDPQIANMKVTGGTPLAMYSFTDIYQQTYWTAPMQ